MEWVSPDMSNGKTRMYHTVMFVSERSNKKTPTRYVTNLVFHNYKQNDFLFLLVNSKSYYRLPDLGLRSVYMYI